MRYTLRMKGVIVGRSDLERRDAGAHMAGGAFRAGGGWELMEPVFELDDAARAAGPDSAEGRLLAERFARASASLGFELEARSGARFAARDVRIRTSATGDRTIELRVDEPAFWDEDG